LNDKVEGLTELDDEKKKRNIGLICTSFKGKKYNF